MAGVLTSLEWAQDELPSRDTKANTLSEDALFTRTYQNGSNNGSRTPSEVNHRLLVKIDEMLASVSGVSFERVSTDDPRYLKAKRLADEAAARRASREMSTGEGQDEEEEQSEVVLDGFNETA